MNSNSEVMRVASNSQLVRSAPVVFVIDDNPAVRESLGSLISSAGWQVVPYGYGDVFDAIQTLNAVTIQNAEMLTLRDRYASLTDRQREVMRGVVSGLLNKQIAGELGITETTVKVHRGNMMRKMQADSLAALVTMAVQMQLVSLRGTCSHSNSFRSTGRFREASQSFHPGSTYKKDEAIMIRASK